MPNLTQSSFVASYIHQLPIPLQDLINQNRDILNFILDGELQKEGPHSLKKLRSVYQGRGEALRNLEIEGFIDNSKYAGKTTLRFPGFFSCTSEDAKVLHEMAKRIYRILFESYKNFEEERWFSSQDLVKAVWPLPDLPEYYRALNKILISFNTAPIHVVTLQDNLGFDHPTSNVPIVRAGEQIIDFKDLEALILESSKKFSMAFHAKYSVPVENYNIKEESFIWDENLKDQKEYRCFVIMPIGDKETSDYKNNMMVFNQIIKKVVTNCGYKINCYHADVELFAKSGGISKRIFEYLRDDEIVIADLRRCNVNVIYELGIRHAIGKRSILICSKYAENFFHNNGYTAIKYEINGESNQDFYKRMKPVIDDIIQNPDTSDNPFTDSMGRFLIGEVAKTKPSSAEEIWYRNQGGALYNLLSKSKEAKLYLEEGGSRKFLTQDRTYFEGVLTALGKTIKTYSTDTIFQETIPIRDIVAEIGRKLIELGDHDLLIRGNDVDAMGQECIKLINTLLIENTSIWKKLSVYLLNFEKMRTDLIRKLDILQITWEKIDDDLFLDRNHQQITRDCERFAKELDFIGSEEVYQLEAPDKNFLNATVKSFMQLFLPPYADGGVSMRAFREQYQNSLAQSRLLLKDLKSM